MIAVVKIGGHQAIVTPGEQIEVDKINVEAGKKVELEVLLISEEDGKNFQIGAPILDTKIEAKVIEHGRGKKVRVYKMKPRKRYRRTKGHRQDYSVIEIGAFGGASKAAPKKAEAKAAKPAAKKAAPKKTGADDLTKVEGVGPKIAELMNKAGISSFEDLSKAKKADLQKILDEAGARYKMHDPSTWAKQAKLAHAGKWDELKTLQDELDGGKKA